MNSCYLLVTLAVVVGAVSAQYIGAPIPYARQTLDATPIHEDQQEAYSPLAHPALIDNARLESTYPAEWTNDQYKNPKIAAALARESWLTDKEMPVFERVAEKIPREQVFKIFKNAGFISR